MSEYLNTCERNLEELSVKGSSCVFTLNLHKVQSSFQI